MWLPMKGSREDPVRSNAVRSNAELHLLAIVFAETAPLECPTCGGSKLEGEQPWRRGDGGYIDPAHDEREPCPCTQTRHPGLAPRGMTLDLENWEGEPPALSEILRPRCGTCKGDGWCPKGDCNGTTGFRPCNCADGYGPARIDVLTVLVPTLEAWLERHEERTKHSRVRVTAWAGDPRWFLWRGLKAECAAANVKFVVEEVQRG